jgi:rod shape determining protein RodA
MTVSALTRPGERDRLIVKLGEIDWIFCLALTLIAAAGTIMQFSIAGSSWTPWAAPHLIRYIAFFGIMLVLSVIDLRVWFAIAYPIYAAGFVLLVLASWATTPWAPSAGCRSARSPSSRRRS